MRLVTRMLWLMAMLAVAGGGARAQTNDPLGKMEALTERVRAEVEWIGGFGPRITGYDNQQRFLEALEERLSAIPGVQVFTDDFEVVVPVYTERRLEVLSGSAEGGHEVYPLHPSLGRLNTTGLEGIEATVVYVGEGRPEEIDPRGLNGQIAAMEVTGGRNWQRVAAFGPAALLLLGNAEKETSFHYAHHLQWAPVGLPRIYVEDGALAERIRAREVTEARLTVKGAWERRTATNLFALAPLTAETRGMRAMGVAVAADAASYIPDLAYGADAAVDTALAVNLLEDFAENPPARPVLFTFLDSWGIYHRGTREMMATLNLSAEQRAPDFDGERDLLESYRQHRDVFAELEASGEDAYRRVHEARYNEIHQYIKDTINTQVTMLDTELEPARLAAFDAEPEEAERLEARVEELAQERNTLLAMQRQMLTSTTVEETIRPRVLDTMRKTRERLENQVREVEALLAREDRRTEVRDAVIEALGLEENVNPIGFLLGIELSDAGVAAGPSFKGFMFRETETPNTREIQAWMRMAYENERDEIWPEEIRVGLNLQSILTNQDFESYVSGALASMTATAGAFGMPALTWTTLNGFRTKVDTGRDRPENLNWTRLGPQLAVTQAFVNRLCYETDFEYPQPARLPRWRRLTGTVVDQAPGAALARLPMEGYLTTLIIGNIGGGTADPHVHWGDVRGMRRLQYVYTMTDGRFVNDYYPGYMFPDHGGHYVQSFKIAEDGSIVRAVDVMRSGKGVNLKVNALANDPAPIRALVFTCELYNAFDLTDPRFFMDSLGPNLVDARRDNSPRRANYTFKNGVLSLMMEPKSRYELHLQLGNSNRMILVNMLPEEEAEGRSVRDSMLGFPTTAPLPSHPWYLSALDFTRLNTDRVETYRSAGITSKPIDELRERTMASLERAEQALEEADGRNFFLASGAALANEVRAYSAIRAMANDVVRGAIFLLLALVPFAYTMERLLVGSPYIYRQIGTTLVIFTIMSLILYAFHPAFRISAQPMVIVLAFAIILMSLMVISMVFTRFEREVEEHQRGRAEASGASSSGSGLLVTAFRLGIANMRNRKLRTALTSITVILITFTLLAFSSTSSFFGQRENTLDAESPYTGVLIRQPSIRKIVPNGVDIIETRLRADYTTAIRGWWHSPWSGTWRLIATAPDKGTAHPMRAALGLTPEEALFTGIDKVVPNWEAFSRGDVCYLAEPVAEKLGVVAGDEIVIAGRSLTLGGVFNPERMNGEVLDMDGEPIVPFDYHALGYEQRLNLISGDWSIGQLQDEIGSGAGLEPLRRIPHMDSSDVVIVPVELFPGGEGEPISYRSIAALTETEEEARALARDLVDRFAFPIYFGTPTGVTVMASTPLLPQAPKGLVVPLIIAGLIIFNTMLSSIAERKKEIYIYTSLGLAPIHVGVLFLAEAVTYGLMGSIFGYVFGQWLATILSELGLLGTITLNYSGTQAVATMALVMVVIIISALVPAFLAGRLATPSNKMTWEVPKPENDVIRDTLPFTVTEKTSGGVLEFLYEYFEAHTEGAIGAFTVDALKMVEEPDGAGGTRKVLEATVWLAPYDLGVRQRVRLMVAASDVPEVYTIDIEMVRGSGHERTWWKLNRMFLADLRRQLLGWRDLPTPRVIDYIKTATERLRKAHV